jgi:toxin-antitoxin system PIN domain toxin
LRIVDLNVLLYATDTESAHHETAKAWLDDAMRGAGTIGLPTAVTVGFVRITTNPRIMRRPLKAAAAIEIVQGWLARSNVTVLEPTERHYAVLLELLEATGVGGNLVTDAHLGALAVEHGAELWSFDNDFDRFPGVVWRRPGT